MAATGALKLFLPGLGGWFFLFLLALFLFVRPQLLLWDGAPCRHFLNGVYFFHNHQIPTTNYPSALFPNDPALTRCLVGDFANGAAYQLWGLNGIVLLSALSIALALTWSYQLARARGLGLISGLLAVVVTIVTCSMHWSARCYVFSYLTLMVLYYVTFMSAAPPLRRLVATAAVMAVWVNVHGSSTVGLMVLAARALGDLVEAAWRRGEVDVAVADAGGAGSGTAPPVVVDEATPTVVAQAMAPSQGPSPIWSLAALAAGFLGTLLSVWGPGLYLHLFDYVQNPATFIKGGEWRSLDFSLGGPTWTFLFTFLAVVGLWIISGAKPQAGEFFLVVGLFLAGVHSMRIAPYFALIAVPALGPPWQAFRRSVCEVAGEGSRLPWLQRWTAKLMSIEVRVERAERNMLSAALARVAVAAVMATVFLALPQLRVRDFDPETMPVKAVDYLKDSGLTGLGFALDNWGGYLYWRLGRPIFIDDWVEFFPPDFVNEYVATMMAQTGWQSVLDKYRVDWVLIPRSTLLGAALAQSPQWSRKYSDQICDLYLRNVGGTQLHSESRGKQ